VFRERPAAIDAALCRHEDEAVIAQAVQHVAHAIRAQANGFGYSAAIQAGAVRAEHFKRGGALVGDGLASHDQGHFIEYPPPSLWSMEPKGITSHAATRTAATITSSSMAMTGHATISKTFAAH
jgi:hypothetical protein